MSLNCGSENIDASCEGATYNFTLKADDGKWNFDATYTEPGTAMTSFMINK